MISIPSAATMLVAGAITAGAFGAAAPANAADSYVGLAYSFESNVSGVANNQPDVQSASNAALENCQNKGGNHCVFYGYIDNGCIALAIDGVQQWATATAPLSFEAQRLALQQNPGGHIAVSGCSGNSPGRVGLPPGSAPPPGLAPPVTAR